LNPERAVTNVEVTGPVTRAEIQRWRDDFSEALPRSQSLRIDLAGSGPWDLAGVQLLLATMASGRIAGRSISLARVPNVLKVVAERAALLDRLAAIAED
jgi:ABC-type transporter Mla MlaB component